MSSNEILRSLAARIEQCSGADPELDAAIHVALDRSGTAARHYTGSVDAALSLIADGHFLSGLFQLNASSWHAGVASEHVDDYQEAQGPTAAVAICMAALKMRRTP